MLKVLQVFVLSSLLIVSARAEDIALMVNKHYHQKFQVGGILSYFRKDKGIEESWIDIHPMSGTIVIQSVALDPNCKFDGVVLPAAVQNSGNLEIRPDCNVKKAEILTNRGLYRFVFDKSVE